MLDWIDARLRSWGLARRRIETRETTAKSFMGRVQREVAGASHRNPMVEPMEVMTGDALTASIAIKVAVHLGLLNDKEYEHLFVHYVVPNPISEKCKYLKVKRYQYFRDIHAIHIRLAGCFRPMEDHEIRSVMSCTAAQI